MVVQERAQQNFEVSMGISAHEVTLEQLADEIAEVYERCGFDRDATVTTLQMLTNIEVIAFIHPDSNTAAAIDSHALHCVVALANQST